MTSTGGKWLRFLRSALALLMAMAGESTARAQGGGFGPDPFRPYNSQYDPYRYPTGPATPDGGAAATAISGVRGANQFQDYLNELNGAERQGSEKYGIGLPYYRSAVDPRFREGDLEYRRSRNADRSCEQTQELVTEKYFAYFTEKDPKKRAALLRDYNLARNRFSRALSTRRETPTRILEAATRADSGRRVTAEMESRREARSAVADSNPRSSANRSTPPAPRARDSELLRGDSSRSIPPPPPLFPRESSRASSLRRSPSEVLNRSRRLNSRLGTTPVPNSRPTTARSASDDD